MRIFIDDRCGVDLFSVMIVEDTDRRDQFIYVVNPYDLSGYKPEHVAEQHEFIRWVQETEIEYIPSGRYWSMKEAAEKGENYGIYSGYKYQFWAKSWDDAKAMYDKWPWRMWCEKRHPEPRQMILRGMAIYSKDAKNHRGEPDPCHVIRIENVKSGFIVPDKHLDGTAFASEASFGYKAPTTLREWVERQVPQIVYWGLQDGMNKIGRDVLPTETDYCTVHIPEDFDDTHEFTVTVIYTVPYDAEPERVDEVAAPC